MSSSLSLFFLCSGCGSQPSQQAATQSSTATPSISQVLPQTIAAGSQTTTLRVTGTNFTSKAAILWNGNALTTTLIDTNTLTGTIGSSNLTTPGAVQLKVQDTDTFQESQAVPVTIAAAGTAPSSTLAISTTTLANGTVNTAYAATLTAAGGNSPYLWSITAGQLPAGLTLAADTGIVSGVPVSSGDYSVAITANDSSSPAQSATATLALSVPAAPPNPANSSPLAISTTTLPQGSVGTSYAVPLSAAGGTSPYQWSISSGQLPPGLNLAANTGIISGTPASSGSYSVGIMAIDSSSPMQSATVYTALVTIAAPNIPPSIPPVAISTTALPKGVQSAAYTATLSAAGGTSPYSWSITSGQLPPGLNLAPNTGAISGTPTSSGNYSVGVTATDLSSPAQSASATLALSVAAAPATPSPLTINSSSVPSGTVGSAYSSYLQASGGTAPYTWSLVSGSLPAGLSLAPNSGIISGTPASSGTANFTVSVTDSESTAQNKSVALSLAVSTPPPLGITSASTLPSVAVKSGYSTTLQATGGTAPYIWSIASGSLPAGLSLTPKTGSISGTPTAIGTASFTASVSDSGNPSQTRSISLTLVVSPTPLAITSGSTLPSGKINTSYSTNLQATGGTAPYTWAVIAGSLPAGLTLASNTGIISGTPTSSGSFSFGVTATDSSSPAQSVSAPVDLNVQGSATTLTKLQNDPWVSSGQVSPTYADCDASCPGLTFSMSEGIASPSLSGSAAQWNLGGTNPYSDVLFVDHLIGSASTHGLPDTPRSLIPTLHNFSYDLYFYPTDPAHTQAMEFDINWSLNSVGMTWSTECRMEGGNEWDIWDNVAKHWLPTGFPCYPLANAWNHVTVTGQRGPNNTVIYQTITLNGVVNNINQTFAPYVVPSDWYGVTVNYQMDGDKNQTSIMSYSDNMSFTYW